MPPAPKECRVTDVLACRLPALHSRRACQALVLGSCLGPKFQKCHAAEQGPPSDSSGVGLLGVPNRRNRRVQGKSGLPPAPSRFPIVPARFEGAPGARLSTPL